METSTNDPFVTCSTADCRQLSGHRMFQEARYKPVNGIVQYEFFFRGYVYIQNELLFFVVLFQHTHVELEVDLLFPIMNPHFIPVLSYKTVIIISTDRYLVLWNKEDGGQTGGQLYECLLMWTFLICIALQKYSQAWF